MVSAPQAMLATSLNPQTRHFNLAETRHLNLGLTSIPLIIYLMSNNQRGSSPKTTSPPRLQNKKRACLIVQLSDSSTSPHVDCRRTSVGNGATTEAGGAAASGA